LAARLRAARTAARVRPFAGGRVGTSRGVLMAGASRMFFVTRAFGAVARRLIGRPAAGPVVFRRRRRPSPAMTTDLAGVRGLRFTKMHGLGNDYVYVDCFSQRVEDPSGLAERVADRHFGVGGDGLVLILPSEVADARMRMFNADGSEGEMCGNAVRC